LLIEPSPASALTSSSTSSPTPSALLPGLQSLSLAGGPPSCSSSRSLHTTTPRSWFFNKKAKPDNAATPFEKEATGTADARKQLISRLQGRLTGPAIFKDEAEATAVPEKASGPSGRPRKDPRAYTPWGASLVKEHLSRGADPDPRSRVRWERKMVIRQIQKGTDAFSVEPRAEKIARTERTLLSKSPWLPTSVKKLVHLARQVQGKTVADALTQMRYSKKKMAKEVRVQLEQASDLAVAERGMGLGKVDEEHKQEIKIQTKDGKFVTIDDPTRMYVAQAWVNRGPWRGHRIRYVARGRINILKKPSTSEFLFLLVLLLLLPPVALASVVALLYLHIADIGPGISLVLKEEKTRIREHGERVAKKLRAGPWVHLPDRPVTAQRQYYSW